MAALQEKDLANRRQTMPSLITTLGGIIAAVCSRCQSQRNYEFAMDRLNIVEPAEPARAGAQSAKVVNLASWSDANPTGLELHDPEPTDVVITLGSIH